MIKVAIVEDDAACANELKSFFSRYKIDAGCAMEAEYFFDCGRVFGKI